MLKKLNRVQQIRLKNMMDSKITPERELQIERNKITQDIISKSKKHYSHSVKRFERKDAMHCILSEKEKRPKGKYAYINPLEEILGKVGEVQPEALDDARILHFTK